MIHRYYLPINVRPGNPPASSSNSNNLKQTDHQSPPISTFLSWSIYQQQPLEKDKRSKGSLQLDRI
jgi:hypothetical protein